MIEVVFSHGKEGSPNGSKSKIIREITHRLEMKFTAIDYINCNNVDERVDLLEHTISKINSDIILVGSSMGGYVSAVCSNKNECLGLFLIAPALFLKGYKVQQYLSLIHI